MDQALFPSARAEAAGRRMRDLRVLRARRADPSSLRICARKVESSRRISLGQDVPLRLARDPSLPPYDA